MFVLISHDPRVSHGRGVSQVSTEVDGITQGSDSLWALNQQHADHYSAPLLVTPHKSSLDHASVVGCGVEEKDDGK